VSLDHQLSSIVSYSDGLVINWFQKRYNQENSSISDS
jgi:hypothetical protein